MTSCLNIRARLVLQCATTADGPLDALLQDHLSTCSACRKYYAEQKELVRELECAVMAPAERTLPPRVHRAVATAIRTRATPARPAFGLDFLPLFLRVATLVLGLATGILAVSTLQHRDSIAPGAVRIASPSGSIQPAPKGGTDRDPLDVRYGTYRQALDRSVESFDTLLAAQLRTASTRQQQSPLFRAGDRSE